MTVYKSTQSPKKNFSAMNRPCTPPKPFLDLETMPCTPTSAIQSPMDYSETPGTPKTHKRVVSFEPEDAENIFLPLSEELDISVPSLMHPNTSTNGNGGGGSSSRTRTGSRLSAPRKRSYTKPPRPAPTRMLRRNVPHNTNNNDLQEVQQQPMQRPSSSSLSNIVEDEDDHHCPSHPPFQLSYRPQDHQGTGLYLAEYEEKPWTSSPANVTVPLRRNVSFHALSA